jgi:iron complex outermembrane receptor protein
VYYVHDDGFITNINTGNPGDETREYGTRLQLLLQPSSALRSLTTFRYRNLAGGLNAYTRQASVDEPVYQNQLSFDAYGRRETFALTENLAYDFGPAELTSITSYTRQDHYWRVDGDYRTPNTVEGRITDPRPTEVYTQEFRLASQDTTSWDWLLGLYASRIENLQSQPSPSMARIGPPAAPFFLYADRETLQDDIAAFGTVNFYWGDFTLGTGLRVGRTEYEATIFTHQGVPQTPPLVLSTEETFVLPKVSLAYDLTEDHMLYLSVARGAEPGRASIDTTNPATYDPEFSTQYELGLKSALFDDQFRYELAAFLIDYQDRQYESRVAGPAGIIEVIDNIGDSRSTGVEASLDFRPDSLDGLNVSASIGYLDASWRDGAVLNSIDLSGDEVPNSPRWTGNFGIGHNTPVFDSLELDLHADATYTSEFLWRAGNTLAANTNPEHWLVNARIALSSPGVGWQLAARVDNIFDESYYNEFSPGFFNQAALPPTICAAACHLASVGGQRRAYVSVSYEF